jgi:hypothetical protein
MTRPVARPGFLLLTVGTLAVVRLAGLGHPSADAARSPMALPRPDHTVVVVMENHSYPDVIGNGAAPYINSLRTVGANFTDSNPVTHPSEPNYLALFAGSTLGVTDDSCPHTFFAENIASRLVAAGDTFAGYSESMPYRGYTGCKSGDYARKHNPWVNFANVSPDANRTFAEFPADYGLLPTVSLVVPNLCNDMHDCSVATGDAWLRRNLDAYVQWAMAHQSLLVLTFDESEGSTNQICTIFVGPMVLPGDYGMRIDHYSVLRTLEDLYGLPATGNASSASPILDIWRIPEPTPTPTPESPSSRMPIVLSRRRPGQTSILTPEPPMPTLTPTR